MSDHKFTPGPWTAAPSGKTIQGYGQAYAVANYDMQVAVFGAFSDIPGGEEAAKANAQLAAAAPELLQALREVIDAAQRQLALMGKGREPSPRLQAAIDQGESVIAKALHPKPY